MEELRELPEKTEIFMNRIGIPDEYILKARNQAAAALQGSKPADYDEGAEILFRQLTEAVESREGGPWKRIPEGIWLATMRCYPRFIAEHRRSYGRDGFDRGNWTVRQAGCRLFRIGELEYELFERNGQRAVSIHIPSDARLEPDLLNGSVRQAEAFLSDFFPEWEKLPMICESWLLSPSLKEMLPPESRIRRFQDAFDITEEDPEDTSALEWVFFIAEGQRDSVRYENLPEDTSLQRKMKAALLAGRNPGNAGGTLARAFR